MSDVWQFRDKNGLLVKPYTYNDGTTQIDVVSKLIKEINNKENNSNNLIIMIGSCSSGKSAIALNVLNHYDGGIIVTPTKILQDQYERDYCGGKYNIGEVGNYLNVKNMKGRSNFRCKYNDNEGINCDMNTLPCIKKNKDEPRYKSASVCKHWSPVYPIESSSGISEYLINHDMYSYDSISGLKCYFEAEEPCLYYKQFSNYVSDRMAMIFNLKKWEIETWIGRKPKVEVEIIDEGDEFLDGLAYKLQINKSLFTQLKNDGVDGKSLDDLFNKFSIILSIGKKRENIDNINKFIISLIDLIDCDINSNKSQEVLSKLILLDSNSDECEFDFDRYGSTLTLFIPRFDIPLKKLIDRSGKIVLMSATMQTVNILKNMYKINPVILYAEKDFIGKMNLFISGKEQDVNYNNWKDFNFKDEYYRNIYKIIDVAPEPILIQAHAKSYIPSELECYNRTGWFDYRGKRIMVATNTDRGLDLPDDNCRSIIILKYPLPDFSDPVISLLHKKMSHDSFDAYYKDLANRNLIQQISRGIRHENDWCNIYTPDANVYTALYQYRDFLKYNLIKVNSW